MKNSIFELSPEALEGLFGTEVDDEQLRQNAEIYKEEILKEIQSGSKQRVIDLLKLSRTLSDFDQLRIFFAFGDRKGVEANIECMRAQNSHDPNIEKAISYLNKMTK